jgi:uncharacterized linocin/CFP29 family protein
LVTLTEQEYKYLDEAVKDPPRQILVGRRIATTTGPLGEGVLTVQWNKISEVGAAELFLGQKMTLSEDVIDRTSPSLDMPALARGFRIPRRTIEAARRMGTPIDVITARSASYRVSLLEDELVIKGKEGINGLYDGAGNTDTGADWATPTNIPLAIEKGIAKLREDNIYGPYNLVCAEEQWGYLYALVGNTADYYYDLIKRRIGGDIYPSGFLTTGTVMLTAMPSAGFFDLPLGVEIHAEVEELPLNEFKDLYGVVWEAITPRIRESNAICTLTSLT